MRNHVAYHCDVNNRYTFINKRNKVVSLILFYYIRFALNNQALLKAFFINNESVTKNEYDKNMKELADKLKELNDKSEKNN